MIQKTIYLENIDLVVFHGVNNANLNHIKKLFPKIRIVARDNELIVLGSQKEIRFFENSTVRIIDFCKQYNKLTINDIDIITNNHPEHKEEYMPENNDVILYGNNGKVIKARTVNQIKLTKSYINHDLIIVYGPAGTGKTYTAIALAVKALKNKEVKRIILTRPAVEAGESLGFLPGDLKEKLDPYLQPLYDALRDMIPARKLQELVDERTIEIAPLAFMRGRTLEDAFVILDEGQNCTPKQFKMFLTRMGNNAHFMITGDITQVDLPKTQQSGLVHAKELLKNIDRIAILEFDERDIVRNSLVKNIIKAYDKT